MEGATTPTLTQQGVANMAIPTANFLSYNPTGLSAEKCQFIDNICDENDVMFLSVQEHFKNNKNTDKYFSRKFSNFSSFVIPAYRPSEQDSGRPKAGLAQLSRKGIDVRKDRVSTSSFRIQSQILNFPTCRIMWINAYLPTDPQTVNFDDSELIEVLCEITSIIEKSGCTDVILNGDLNWDPSRNTGFSNTVRQFVENLGLASLWEKFGVDYTHMHTDFVSTSVLDHFLVSERLVPLVESCQVLHMGDNLSRHSPILLRLNVGDIPSKKKVKIRKPKKPAWSKVTEEIMEEYKLDLQERLVARPVPDCLSCVDPHCGDPAHSEDRDTFMLDILCSVVESSHCVLPLAGGGSGPNKSGISPGCVPGWMEEVQLFREDANFWHSVWLSAGKPNRGELHVAMARSRNLYHYAIRRTRRNADLLKAKKMFEASVVSDMQLLEEMKKVRSGGVGADELPDNVAGAEGEQEIVEKFREVYSALYNSASTAPEVQIIKDQLKVLIKQDSMAEVDKITGDVVKEAAGLMKTG